MASLYDQIEVGSRVTILVSTGMKRVPDLTSKPGSVLYKNEEEFRGRTGKAVKKGPAGWVLNMGGKHREPGIATEENVVAVK